MVVEVIPIVIALRKKNIQSLAEAVADEIGGGSTPLTQTNSRLTIDGALRAASVSSSYRANSYVLAPSRPVQQGSFDDSATEDAGSPAAPAWSAVNRRLRSSSSEQSNSDVDEERDSKQMSASGGGWLSWLLGY
jgi:hypothetical protein